MSTTPKHASQPLVVVVSGGGPVGLTFSLHLTMMMGKNAKIFIYEGRWFVDQRGTIKWQGQEQGKIRREQVVTLQDHVINQMPEYIQKGLFERIDECVWPTSRNIPIREVEDRLFDLIQPFVQNGQIELVPENLHEQSERLIKGNFDVLVGADGSNSFVRRYCNIQMISEGVEYACGVAYDIPAKIESNDEPLHQALNCILTVSQTRYLVNSSTSRRGYLNIRLIRNEYDELHQHIQGFQARNEALDLLDYNKCPQSPVWSIIRQGLEFFRIPLKYVFRVLPIEINVRHASIVVRELRYEIEKSEEEKKTESSKTHYKTALAFLAGDAAMNVHFWPGRGMNSGMKAAMALARNIVRACTRKNSIEVRTPLRFLDFLDYEGFMARLRAREQQGRSLRVLVDPIDKYIDAYSYGHLSQCYIRYSNKLIRKLKETRDRLEERPEWPHQSRKITDQELELASKRISPQSVAQLSLANPWPTREMSGVEVLVEDIFPYDLKSFLPVPELSPIIPQRLPTRIIRYRLVNLWIIGDKIDDKIGDLISDIKKSPNFRRTSANENEIYQLNIVQTVKEASEWIKSNRQLIEDPNVRFKVITLWNVDGDQTALDVIRAVRPPVPRVPILIFTNKVEETKPALEFPNVMATGEEFELKEFVGVNQETQWSAGCRVGSHDVKPPAPPSLPIPSGDSLLLWIDSDTSDPKGVAEIRHKYPKLEIIFQTKYSDAEVYLDRNKRDIDERDRFIIICRGFYASENKSFLDVARLFQVCNTARTYLGVYTGNREGLLKRNPNPPKSVEIFDKRNDLFSFIDRCFAR